MAGAQRASCSAPCPLSLYSYTAWTSPIHPAQTPGILAAAVGITASTELLREGGISRVSPPRAAPGGEFWEGAKQEEGGEGAGTSWP